MRFQVGDVVRIAKSSEYYSDDTNNPKDVDGKIERFFNGIDDHKIRVGWSNGNHNSYRESDLRLRSRTVVEPMSLSGSMHYPTGDYEPMTSDDIPF